jgi:NAD(P)-dependent dehydrogenase (short-subunit alcohol dehydrogenase family)
MTAYVVTGASSGIGRACAARLVRRGAIVFAGVRRDRDGEKLRAELGHFLRPILLDVTDPGQVHAARDTVAARLGEEPLDGLVNNAGIAVGGPVEYLPLEEWRQQFEVNLFGVVETTKTFLDLLRRGPGRNVIVGSVGGRWPARCSRRTRRRSTRWRHSPSRCAMSCATGGFTRR